MRRVQGVFPEVIAFGALRVAARRAARGTRSPCAVRWLAELERECLSLQRALGDGTWAPGPLHRFRIRDPKPRTIAAAPFADRVVHHALCAAMEPHLEACADPDSYACRTGRGSLAALRRVQALARRHAWYAKLDVRHFFETVRHDVLAARLARRFDDPPLLDLVARILRGGAEAPGVGLPIGSLTSQHLGNFLLGALDGHARRELRVGGWVRYMDDVLALGASRDEVTAFARGVDAFVRERLGQETKPEATRIAPVHAGIPWLGFRVWPGCLRLDGARKRRLVRRARALRRLAEGGQEAAAAEKGSSVFAWAAPVGALRNAIVSW